MKNWEYELSTIKSLFELSHVPRWCIVDTIKEQSVAEHSFNVACLIIEFKKYIKVPDGLIERAILHDVDEAQTGDIPSPYKEKKAGFAAKKVNLEEEYPKGVLVLADKLEAYIFIERYGIGPRANWAKCDIMEKIKSHIKRMNSSYKYNFDFVYNLLEELVYD
tara:strand:+ start:354 stop:842 length:489 start_codon:yes stop_codon:yes gene_type:complete